MSNITMPALKVWEQKANKNEDGSTKSVTMQCSLNGRKKEDGTYGKSMYINVFLNGDCQWTPDDYSGKYIDVDGNFSISDYKSKDGKEGINYTIFANSVKEHIWENNAPAQGKNY